jgi:hypothetical protein
VCMCVRVRVRVYVFSCLECWHRYPIHYRLYIVHNIMAALMHPVRE